jgi:hypothetical protein
MFAGIPYWPQIAAGELIQSPITFTQSFNLPLFVRAKPAANFAAFEPLNNVQHVANDKIGCPLRAVAVDNRIVRRDPNGNQPGELHRLNVGTVPHMPHTSRELSLFI